MSELSELVKLSLLVNGNGIVDNYKNNTLYFYDLYQKSTPDFKSISIRDMYPGGFYFIHYKDESNWMRYAPIFLTDFKKFNNKVILLAINLNFIPFEIRVMFFDKFITKNDIEKNNFLKVDYKGVYDELRKIGFEYSLMEFDINRIQLVHKVSLSLLPRFLYHQHPLNKYDPEKLAQIWNAKIENREKRHHEMTLTLLSDFYDINSEISEKFDVLRSHVIRLQRNIKKYK